MWPKNELRRGIWVARAETTHTVAPFLGSTTVLMHHGGEPHPFLCVPTNTTMNTLKNRIQALVVASQSLLFDATGGETVTDSTASTFEHLPTALVGPISMEYPQPICARCRLVVERETTVNGDTQGMLSLTYHEDALPIFEGHIGVTVLLGDETKHTETILDVVLGPGEHFTWTLPPRASFSWRDVEHVWVEMVPAQ